MRSWLLACVALVSSGCIKRVAPDAGERRTTTSGAPVAFHGPKGLPEGTKVRWEFGDGTPESAEAEVQHVFPRAGSFTVTQELVDRDGEKRRAQTQVLVLRRGVAAALPADARAVFLAERPWARVSKQREAARRVGLGDLFDETAAGVNDALGFDAQEGAQAEQNGVDTDEGFAVYTVPQDTEALVVAVGISDPAKAEAVVRRLLSRPGHGGPFALRDAQLPGGARAVVGERDGGEKVGYLERLGYLYLRTPGRSDPLLALASAAALTDANGLDKDPSFQATVARVGEGDGLFYSAAPAAAEGGRGARMAGELGTSAFAVRVDAEQVEVKLFVQLRMLTGQALVQALTPRAPPPELAALLPSGAAAFLKLSGEPVALYRELLHALGPDAGLFSARLRELFGTEVESGLLPSFTGNGAVGIYLDAQSLIEGLLGEQVAAFDRSTFLGVAELLPGQEAPLRAAFDKASHDAGGPRQVHGATWWPISDGLQFALRDGKVFLALGGAVVDAETDTDHSGPAPAGLRAARRLLLAAKDPAKKVPAAPPKKGKKQAEPPPPPEPTAAELGPLAAVLLAPAGAPSLAAALVDTGLPLREPTAQLGWLDLHGLLERIDRAAQSQGGLVGPAVRLFTDRARGVRDLLVDARPDQGGLTARFTLRLLPRAAASADGGPRK